MYKTNKTKQTKKYGTIGGTAINTYKLSMRTERSFKGSARIRDSVDIEQKHK